MASLYVFGTITSVSIRYVLVAFGSNRPGGTPRFTRVDLLTVGGSSSCSTSSPTSSIGSSDGGSYSTSSVGASVLGICKGSTRVPLLDFTSATLVSPDFSQ